MNGGKCNGVNKCRCPDGFDGNHCEIVIGQQFHMDVIGHCRKPCRHGVCMPDNRCRCNRGWFGRFCNQHGTLSFFKNEFIKIIKIESEIDRIHIAGSRRNRNGQHHRPQGSNAKHT